MSLDGWSIQIVDATIAENYKPHGDSCPLLCPEGGPSDGCEYWCAFLAGDISNPDDPPIGGLNALRARLGFKPL